MGTKPKLTRRNFIKLSGLAAGSVPFLPYGLSASNNPMFDKDTFYADELLQGVSDIHIHAMPDSTERAINELEFARQAKEAGYRSVMFKSNDFSCHDRAYLIREAVPDFDVFGSLCLNKVYGDKVNPYTVQKAVQTTGNFLRCVWMPTLDAVYQYQYLKREDRGVPVLSDTHKVLPEVVKVMEICADADIIFATGHSSPQEVKALAKKANEIGLKKFVATHVNSNIWKHTHGQILELVELGAYVELCYITNLWGAGTALANFERMSEKEFTDFATLIPERTFISTDLGQKGMPNPIDGMHQCISMLQKNNVPQATIDILVRTNPAYLVGID